MSEEAGPNVGLQQFNLQTQLNASQAGNGASDEGILAIFFRLFRIGKLDFASNFGMSSVFSGLSLQGKSPLGMLETRGGALSKLFENFQGPQGQQVEHANVNTNIDTSASSGGGDAQFAALNTIPSSQMPDIPIQAPVQHATEIAPPIKTGTGRRSAAREEGGRGA